MAAVGEPQVSKDGTAALINVIPEGSPSSDATSELVDEVRASVIPKSGVDAHVGGSTAQLLDLAELIGERLLLIIAVVVGLSMLLLLIAFRSIVALIQAALVNLLSVGAAYGILTAVFQEGHGAAAIGLDGAIPIVSYVPMMMFAILFGLAMDYQVFLLSRVREEVDAGRSPREAVIAGLAGTGKVIASAAAIMVAVFASFILNGDPTVKEFGVGLASAIFIAGAMVCVLLPAVMLLMGRHTGGPSAGSSASRRTCSTASSSPTPRTLISSKEPHPCPSRPGSASARCARCCWPSSPSPLARLRRRQGPRRRRAARRRPSPSSTTPTAPRRSTPRCPTSMTPSPTPASTPATASTSSSTTGRRARPRG